MSNNYFLQPKFNIIDVEIFVINIFGKSCKATKLVSYNDQNFQLKDNTGKDFVLKISNTSENYEILDAQNKAMEHLLLNQINCPVVCSSQAGEKISTIKNKEGTTFYVRLLTFLQGTFIGELNKPSVKLYHNLGLFIASVTRAFESFSHSALHRYLKWDLKNSLDINDHLNYIENPEKRTIVEHFMVQFQIKVVPKLSKLRTGVIHNDANQYNTLVNDSGDEIAGIIDFGDMVYSHVIFEPAIAIAYAILSKDHPIDTATQIVECFHKEYPLTETELELLFYLIAIRLCASVTYSAYEQKLEPENEYLKISEKQAWDTLEKLIIIDPLMVQNRFRKACKFMNSTA